MQSDDTDAQRRLRAALANLPFIQRDVFRFHRIDGLSYAEIAWLTGMSVKRVERQMAHAIYKLCKQMDDYPLSWWERWF